MMCYASSEACSNLVFHYDVERQPWSRLLGVRGILGMSSYCDGFIANAFCGVWRVEGGVVAKCLLDSLMDYMVRGK